MKILWLSWRDIKNPDSGGAEKVAIEIAKRLVKDKIQVTIFTSQFKNSKRKESINGINIIRRGNRLTCRLYAYFYYRKNKDFDVIIDEINTIPFFANFYAKHKTRVLIYQLAKEYWWKESFFPLNFIGYYLESLYLKTYRSIPTITISHSTKKDLSKLNFKRISIIQVGIDFKPQLVNKKENLILFIGR